MKFISKNQKKINKYQKITNVKNFNNQTVLNIQRDFEVWLYESSLHYHYKHKIFFTCPVPIGYE